MSWCEECDRSTLELCDRNFCRNCCKHKHSAHECNRYEGEWGSDGTGSGDDDDTSL